MGLDFLDIVFRLEVEFGIKLKRKELEVLFDANQPSDILIGDLFDYVMSKARPSSPSTRDGGVDEGLSWIAFQQVIADSLGVGPEDVTREKWLIRELGR